MKKKDIEVRKKPLSFDWPIWPPSVPLQWSILSLHMDIYHLSQLSETEADMTGVVWSTHWGLGFLLLWHTCDKDSMELVTWSGPCSTGRTPAQDSRTEPWRRQDGRPEFHVNLWIIKQGPFPNQDPHPSPKSPLEGFPLLQGLWAKATIWQWHTSL